MPDILPMHADFTGSIDRYVPKTLGSAIGFSAAFEAFMAACFIFSHWMILRSKHSDFARPAAWAVVGGFVALSVAFIILMFYLAG